MSDSHPMNGPNVHTCCGFRTQVINSRPTLNGLRRRRRCQQCGRRYTTMEVFMPDERDHVGITNDMAMLTALPAEQRDGVRAMLRLLNMKNGQNDPT